MTIEIDEQRIKNLEALRDYLNQEEDRFSSKFTMVTYSEKYGSGAINREPEENCGSCGCAVGHGPYAGVKKSLDESWNEYCSRNFVEVKFELGEFSPLYKFLFHHEWCDVDNTRKGAAQRIQYFLDKRSVPIEGTEDGTRHCIRKCDKIVKQYFKDKV